MTEHDRMVFDLKGYLVKPAVLSGDEVAEIKAFVLRQRDEPQSLPPHQRQLPGGPFERLIDHPAVMDVLLDVIDKDVEKIRLENIFLSYREEDEGKWSPHAGGRTTNPNYAYNFHDGRIYSGMTRVVWELTEVREDRGGTCFIPGSHKANFNIRQGLESIDRRDSGLWESYGCPAGSVLFFTEALCHTGAKWTNPAWERVAVFNCYNTVNAKWHDWEPHPELLADMPPLRRTLFRSVHCQNNAVTPEQTGSGMGG